MKRAFYHTSEFRVGAIGTIVGVATWLHGIPDEVWKSSWPSMLIYLGGRVLSKIGQPKEHI